MMTQKRAEEIECNVVFNTMANVQKTLVNFEDRRLIFQIGLNIGYMHRALIEELAKEIEDEEAQN